MTVSLHLCPESQTCQCCTLTGLELGCCSCSRVWQVARPNQQIAAFERLEKCLPGKRRCHTESYCHVYLVRKESDLDILKRLDVLFLCRSLHIYDTSLVTLRHCQCPLLPGCQWCYKTSFSTFPLWQQLQKACAGQKHPLKQVECLPMQVEDKHV